MPTPLPQNYLLKTNKALTAEKLVVKTICTEECNLALSEDAKWPVVKLNVGAGDNDYGVDQRVFGVELVVFQYKHTCRVVVVGLRAK